MARRPPTRTLVGLVSLASMGLQAGPVHATLMCKGIDVTVEAQDPGSENEICNIAADALNELPSCNVKLTEPVTIVITDNLPDHCVGLFHCGETLIELLSPETLGRVRSDDSLFAPLSDDVYFASVITHELAHAAMDAVPCPFHACVATTEYVAYAMQLRSLPDMLRTEVIRDASQVVVRDEINPMIALMAPDIFARKAWLHFSQRPDPCGYVDWIMQGDIVFDHELP